MHIMSALTAVAVFATVPLASHAQTRPSDDHNAHHPAQAQAAPPAPGGMDMKGGAGPGKMGGMDMKGGGGAGMMGGDMGRMMAMMHGGMMQGGMMGGMPLKHVEGRLAFLKAELKITPAQEPQWTKFADTVRGTVKSEQGAMPMKQSGAQPSTAPDLLGRYEKALTSRLETVRALKGAFEPLYNSLSDEQKKAADELLTGPMGIM